MNMHLLQVEGDHDAALMSVWSEKGPDFAGNLEHPSVPSMRHILWCVAAEGVAFAEDSTYFLGACLQLFVRFRSL